MTNPNPAKALDPLLWGHDEQNAYAILDGARINTLLDKLFDEKELKHECLFSGELEPDMAEVAHYLVHIKPESDFTEWVYSGWGGAWGIYVIAPAELEFGALRRHLRKLNMVYGPEKQPLYFRWYDPRVLRMVLPTFSPAQLKEMFGPVLRFIAEGETPDHGIVYSFANGELVQERFVVKE